MKNLKNFNEFINESRLNEGKKEDLAKQLEVVFAQIKSMNIDKNAELIFVKNHIALGFLEMLSKPGAIKTMQDKSTEAKKRLIDAQAALNSAKSTEEIKSILVGLVETVNEE
jgi:hypothetical protein